MFIPVNLFSKQSEASTSNNGAKNKHKTSEKQVSSPKVYDLGNGIKTTMEVFKVSNNHLVFKESVGEENVAHPLPVSGGQPYPTGMGTDKKVDQSVESSNGAFMECDPGKDNTNGEGVKPIDVEGNEVVQPHAAMHT